MKLYTICSKEESLIDLKSTQGVKFQEYSMKDYEFFIEIAKKYYIQRYFSWYETDMSDSDSGSITDYYPINYNNMVVKDNKLYGVLVKTRGSLAEYYLLDFEKKQMSAALGGGYNDLDYDWCIKDNSFTNLEAINVSSNYILLCEKIAYNGSKLYSYEREVVGFLPQDCIIKNGCIIGLSYKNDSLLEFIFSNEESLTKKTETKNGKFKNITNIKLVKLDEKFLNKNIKEVSYNDFKKGNFKILDL